MDGLSSAASVIAVIQLTATLVKICGGYIQEVKDARDDIITLQRAITSLQRVLQDLQRFLQSNNDKVLPTSSRLDSNIAECLSDLQALEVQIDPGRGMKLMRRVGFRALKWPLKRTEIESVVQKLEGYKSSFTLSLQVDQITLITGMIRHAEHVDQMTDLDKLPIAHGAEYNSYRDQHEDECLLGTRTELLQQITKWAMSPHEKCLFWLNGMAGTGKSTISRTVAKSLRETKHLGASFFFKRGEGDRGNATKFLPTLARQLVLRFPELANGVRKALLDDPDVASKSLKEQFDKLLLHPLLDLDVFDQQLRTAVIVVDALDECDDDNDVRIIIRLLPSLQEAKAIRLRIFLTSRPELPILLGFSKIANHDYQDLALHEIPEKVTEHDISLYLKDRFATIRRERNMPPSWPGDDVINDLVAMSVPSFISAATVCRYIENSKWNPTTRLAELLKDQARYATKMDKTYQPILTRLLCGQDDDELEQQQLLQEFQEIVGVIILLAVPLSINALSPFLGIRPDLIGNRLGSFRSVLSVPDNRDLPVRILHLSFRDFLVQSNSLFRVEEATKHADITGYCLATMRRHLKNNICNLEGPGTHRAEIDPQSIRRYIPPELQYSCRYWVLHLEQSNACSSVMEDVLLFLHGHFLHWVESMSLLGLVSDMVGILHLLQTVISGDHHSELSAFLHDAKRFILKNRQIADDAPLQIYCSGLVFAPRTAIIRREFKTELPTWICQLPDVDERWSPELQALEGHSAWVESVAFSPDGRLLASSSGDETVRLWDTTTGALQQTLGVAGLSGSVNSVAFSPDGQLLASGSNDKGVRLWDTMTGTLQQTLRTLAPVLSVAFSPHGRLLASGSSDGIAGLWDTTTGTLQQTLSVEGCLGWVESLAFSPDGQLLVSGSNAVRLWDTTTGALQQTLGVAGHSGSVNSVAFSPNGRLLASGSDDKGVRLWDTATGTLQRTLRGHSRPVTSVAFSPDGRLLASGSSDKTMQLWDTTTGMQQQTLSVESSGWVNTVAFSPDGRLLASGSTDETVRLWDTSTSALQQSLEGYSSSVWSVNTLAFSPDGRLLASGSSDKTVQLWDTATGTLQRTLTGHPMSVKGKLQRTLRGHSRPVTSVAFSPDGRLLASGSSDKTVQLWDTVTGALQQTQAVEGIVTNLEFSQDGSSLNTNLGAIDIHSMCDSPASNPPHVDLEISTEHKQWIKLNGEKVLWLPVEFRPRCVAINGSILALGHASGRISFIGFRA